MDKLQTKTDGLIVTAIESFKYGVLRTYGDGILYTKRVPDCEPFAAKDIPNPCIELYQGGFVWGHECWWGEVEMVKERLGDNVGKIIIVKPKNIKPKTYEQSDI